MDEGAYSFGELFAVGPGGGGIPVEVYGHSIRTIRVVDKFLGGVSCLDWRMADVKLLRKVDVVQL